MHNFVFIEHYELCITGFKRLFFEDGAVVDLAEQRFEIRTKPTEDRHEVLVLFVIRISSINRSTVSVSL